MHRRSKQGHINIKNLECSSLAIRKHNSVLTHISDDAAWLLVQQKLLHSWPSLVAAVIKERRNPLVHAVNMVSLQLAGSLVHAAHKLSKHSILSALRRSAKETQ